MDATIKDIAARAGVSISTVHYALSGTRPIREATRERVLAAVRELDYQPHSSAATLPSGRTGRLAVVIAGLEPAFANTYFSDYVRGLAAAAEARDYTVVLYTAYRRRADEGWRPAHVLRRREADGIVLLGTQVPREHLDELAARDAPCVLLNREHPGLPSISADRRQGAAQGTAHLLALGHHPVALFAGDFPGGGPAGERPELAGFLEAHRAVGREVAPALVRFAPAPGRAAPVAGELLGELGRSGADGRRPGLLLFSYTLAGEVCRAIAGAGLEVPDDLALVVGDEDSGLQEPLDVPLTTVQAPKFEMGEAAVALLLERIQKGPGGGAVTRLEVPMRLKVRRSCGARSTGPERVGRV
ncbi:MAG TPA: LacI family DNA-binding transcriptional regulator [Chloroflexota bacterium]|nr:LacI family DNA-binding transcriptional regulator [Chloroflexota bacterium]